MYVEHGIKGGTRVKCGFDYHYLSRTNVEDTMKGRS